ncbi:MAG: VOC family protein, partial [Rhizobiales bacterium]|nr:VOC family protein [Hyphomicrobiales bacterium]
RQPGPRREAGLFHTAFLLPSRAVLGRWLAHTARTGLALLGASDHIVSEAVYLNDPEDNGIEVYADRAIAEWRRSDGMIEMSTAPLDLDSLVAAGDGKAWTGMPAASFIGHVHLQVGDLAEAERFYAGLFGFDVTYRVPGATFYSSGGYHHHLATNVWSSRGAGIRQEPVTGLRAVELVAASPAIRDRLGAAEIRDPWGTAIGLSLA